MVMFQEFCYRQIQGKYTVYLCNIEYHSGQPVCPHEVKDHNDKLAPANSIPL